jgi:hypothetical protein
VVVDQAYDLSPIRFPISKDVPGRQRTSGKIMPDRVLVKAFPCIDAKVQSGGGFARRFLHRRHPIDKIRFAGFPSDKDVLRDRQIGHQIELLVNGYNTDPLAFKRSLIAKHLPIKFDRPGVLMIGTAGD